MIEGAQCYRDVCVEVNNTVGSEYVISYTQGNQSLSCLSNIDIKFASCADNAADCRLFTDSGDSLPDAGANFLIVQFNVYCLRNKSLDTETFFNDYHPDVLWLSEHWLTLPEVEVCVPPSYTLDSAYYRKYFKNGGSCIMVWENLRFTVIDLESICSDKNFEICAVQVPGLNLVVSTLYSSPDGCFENFYQ